MVFLSAVYFYLTSKDSWNYGRNYWLAHPGKNYFLLSEIQKKICYHGCVWRGDGRRGGHSLKPGIDGAETELNDKNDLNALSYNLLREPGLVLLQQKNLLPCGSKFFPVRAPSGINRIKLKR